MVVGRKILVIGDSHTHALKAAIKSLKNNNSEFSFEAYRYKKPKNDGFVGDLTISEIVKLIKRLTPNDAVVSTTGGNQHSVFGLIQHPIPFDFFVPGLEHIPVADGAQIIPYHIIYQHFLGGLQNGDSKLVSQLASAACCPVFHLTPPPPKRDGDFIKSNHETQFAARGLLDNGVSPAPLRYKLWKLQTDLTRRLYKKSGVSQLMPPKAALDEDGYLRPEFYANDATHANKKYGALVLQQIKETILAFDGKLERPSLAESLQNVAG